MEHCLHYVQSTSPALLMQVFSTSPLLLMQVYFNLLNLQQMIIINAFHGLRRRRLIAIQLQFNLI